MANNNSGKITIANIIAIVGLVLLLVFSFLGHSYLSGGELGWDIIVSLAVTAFTAFLLWFMIKAKGAERDLGTWRIIEYVTLGIYIVVAIPLSLFCGIMHFFVVNDNKETIKQDAEADLQKIESVFTDYKNFEENAISITGTGLRNATGIGQICDASLREFMDANHIQHTRESANNFETIQRNMLIESGYKAIYDSYTQQQNEIKNSINSWSIVQIPMKAKLIEELATSTEKELNSLAEKAKLPTITYDINSRSYTIGEYQKKTFAIQGGIDSFKFRKALKEADGFSLTAIFIVLLIHILILINYIVAYRTSNLGISKHSIEDGGMTLN